jgi:hypothetical protein
MSFMNKTVEIFVDGSSWPGSVAPAEIAGLASLSPRTTNVGLALIHSALWTRPPLSFGFHLADLWAWLRYLPAISNSPDLRLRTYP